jgi:hypothetical protein
LCSTRSLAGSSVVHHLESTARYGPALIGLASSWSRSLRIPADPLPSLPHALLHRLRLYLIHSPYPRPSSFSSLFHRPLSPLANALPLVPPLAPTSPSLAKQVTRALTIKTQYLTKTAHELDAKRKQAEVAVESGIMGLGLLSKDSA